jgi:hypothetical protein
MELLWYCLFLAVVPVAVLRVFYHFIGNAATGTVQRKATVEAIYDHPVFHIQLLLRSGGGETAGSETHAFL